MNERHPPTYGPLALPVVGSLWRHFEGATVVVDSTLNLHSDDPAVILIAFHFERALSSCGCTLADWREKMEPLSARPTNLPHPKD